MKQILKKLNHTKVSYILFNEGVILFLLFLVAVIVASFILESNILKLPALEFKSDSVLMWLFIGGPAIALGLAFILSFVNYFFISKILYGIKYEKFGYIKKYINLFCVFVIIMLILILATIGSILGGLFFDNGADVRSWEKLGFNNNVNPDLYLQFYVFGSWAIGLLILIAVSFTLFYAFSTRETIYIATKTPNYNSKIVTVLHREIKTIRKKVSFIDQKMDYAKTRAERLAMLLNKLKTLKVNSRKKVLRKIEQTKMSLQRNSDTIFNNFDELEKTITMFLPRKSKQEINSHLIETEKKQVKKSPIKKEIKNNIQAT